MNTEENTVKKNEDEFKRNLDLLNESLMKFKADIFSDSNNCSTADPSEKGAYPLLIEFAVLGFVFGKKYFEMKDLK